MATKDWDTRVRTEDFAIGRLVEPATLVALGREGLLIHVELSETGAYQRSVAVALVDAPLETVREAVAGIVPDGGFLNNLNMISGFESP